MYVDVSGPSGSYILPPLIDGHFRFIVRRQPLKNCARIPLLYNARTHFGQGDKPKRTGFSELNQLESLGR